MWTWSRMWWELLNVLEVWRCSTLINYGMIFVKILRFNKHFILLLNDKKGLIFLIFWTIIKQVWQNFIKTKLKFETCKFFAKLPILSSPNHLKHKKNLFGSFAFKIHFRTLLFFIKQKSVFSSLAFSSICLSLPIFSCFLFL